MAISFYLIDTACKFVQVKQLLFINISGLYGPLTFLFFSYSIKQVVSVVLENYGGPNKKSENMDHDKQGPQNRWVQEVLKNEGHVSPSPDITIRVPSWRTIVNDKGEVHVSV